MDGGWCRTWRAGWRRPSPLHQRISWHQLVRMLPPGQRLDAFHPGADRRIILGDIEAEFFSRVIHVARERYVRDGGTCAQEIGGLGEPLVDDAEIVGEAAFEERLGARIAHRGEVAQEAIGSQKAVDFLIIENDPAQRVQALVLALGLELAGAVGEVREADTGLAEFSGAMDEHRDFAHFVDLGAEFRRARLAAGEEVYPDRFPFRADQVEHQGDAIGIAGLGEAVELVFGRCGHCDVSSLRVEAGVGWEDGGDVSAPSRPLPGPAEVRRARFAVKGLTLEIDAGAPLVAPAQVADLAQAIFTLAVAKSPTDYRLARKSVARSAVTASLLSRP